jgi:hypothetical protein
VKCGQAVRDRICGGGDRDGGRGRHRDGLAYDSCTPPPPPGKSVQSLRSRYFRAGLRVWVLADLLSLVSFTSAFSRDVWVAVLSSEATSRFRTGIGTGTHGQPAMA